MGWEESRQLVQRWFLVPWGPELQRALPQLHAWREPAKFGRGTGRIVVYRQPAEVCFVAALDVEQTRMLRVVSMDLWCGLAVLEESLHESLVYDWFALPDLPRPGPEPSSVDVVLFR